MIMNLQVPQQAGISWLEASQEELYNMELAGNEGTWIICVYNQSIPSTFIKYNQELDVHVK